MVSVDVTRPPALASDTDDVRSVDPVNTGAGKAIPNAVLVVAVGVFLVALAYARAREGSSLTTPLFWTGQVLLFGFISFRVLNPYTPARERECLALLYASAQAMLRWAYSPHMFTWSDELQHYRSLLNVLATHHLFDWNFSLPISPRYPALENVTAELAQVSPVAPFVAGTIIAGVSHLLLAGCILLLFREVSRSSYIACIGATLYFVVSPQARYLHTSFIYETAALPFVALSILFAIRFAIHRRGRYQSFAGLLACDVIVTMTHHVSAIATAVFLGVLALATSLSRRTRNLSRPIALCAGSAALIVGCWISFVAPTTGDYLGNSISGIVTGIGKLGHVQGRDVLWRPAMPLIDLVGQPGGVLLMMALLAVGLRLAVDFKFMYDRPPLLRPFIWIAFISYGVAIASRLAAADGGELAGRMFAFVSLFTALAVAVVLERLVSLDLGLRRRLISLDLGFRGRSVARLLSDISGGLISATAVAIVLLVYSVTVGMPAFWQRVPDKFWIEGWQSGIDTVYTSRAEWAAMYLQPGLRLFGDFESVLLMAVTAELDPINYPGSVYYHERLTPEDCAFIDGQNVVYVDVDTRLGVKPLPPTGKYFGVEIAVDKFPKRILGPEDLAKFDDIPEISRIYDSGIDHFYDLRSFYHFRTVRQVPYGN
jgi:hypothetical protein